MITTKQRKRFVTAAILVALLGFFYPFETTVVPEWKVRVVDERMKPLSNLVVREQWRNHSVEFHGHIDDRKTDSDGSVFFPRRTVRASLIFRIAGWTVSHLNVHGESGPKASTLVLGSYLTSSNSDYSPEKPLPEVIIVRPQP